MSIQEQFAARFAGLRHGYSVFTPTKETREDGKAKGKYVTISQTLNQKELISIWAEHLRGERSLGIVPIDENNMCVWGAIDIDDYPLDLKGLSKKIKKFKLPMVVTRSKSGGAHIFLFVFDPVPCSLMQRKLRQVSAAIGFGQSEVFPKQTQLLLERGDRGSPLQMPYFGGEDATSYGFSGTGAVLTPEKFLEYCDDIVLTEEDLEKLEVTPIIEDSEWLNHSPPCLEHLIAQGFPKGMRNSGLFNVGVFLRKKFPDDWEKRIEQINHKHFNPPLSAQEVLGVAKQVQKKDYFYKCNDQPIAGHCNSPLCRTRKYGIGASGGTPLFSNLTKQNSDPPIWFLDVEGGRLELETEELLNQTRFQRKCMDSLNIIPPKVRDNVWRTIIQQLLDNLTIIEVPQDASTEGHFNELLETFCTERPARERDELLLGKPWNENTRTYFKLADLMDFLHRKNFRDYPRNKLTAKLKNMGGESHFFNIKGKGVNVWHIPEFQTQTESHTLPEFNDSPL